MKKIWKIMILCMILCFFCAGCSNDDEMISEDHPKPTTEKRTEIIKQKTTQKKNEVTVDQEQSKQQEDRIKIAIDAGHQLSNKKRALMANESGSDILLRIHCNSVDSQSANGALTMSPTLSNPYCRSIAADSQELSECVVSTLCRRTGAVNRGVTQTDEMTGINWSKIPVTIVEMGFMSNQEEDQKLSDNHYQSMLAEGIADGVDRYYERRGEKNEEK